MRDRTINQKLKLCLIMCTHYQEIDKYNKLKNQKYKLVENQHTDLRSSLTMLTTSIENEENNFIKENIT